MEAQGNVTVKERASTGLIVPDEVAVKQELQLVDPTSISTQAVDSNLEKQADDFIEMLLSGDIDDQKKKMAVDQMGAKTQKIAAQRSKMLQQPINNLVKTGEDGGPVAKSLVDLKMQVEALDPVKFDFAPGWFSRSLGFLPFIGTPLKKYFTQYESAQTVIDAIIKSLEKGRDQLRRDTITLSADQKSMREMTIRLERAIQLGQLLDQKLQYKLDRDIPPEDPKYNFISDELLFPLRQRVMDLQQQLAVNQQGVLATEIIIRNNRELMRGVNRALNVTVNALQVAVTVALGLANQKIVLKKIEAINKTTSDLIANTAQQLRMQGAQIHKQASQAALDMNSLEKAFADINAALDDISKFRREALPQMANSILRMNTLTDQAEESISKIEQGTQLQSEIIIDVE
ncbi:MAG: toxic anion resistance protein [bacterium]